MASLADLEFLEYLVEVGFKAIAGTHLALTVLMSWIIWFNTPPEMAILRYTATNGISWVTASVFYFAVAFRPVLMAPLPVASVKGLIIDYAPFEAQWGIYVGLALVMNLTTAFVLCLATQYTGLVAPLLRHRLRRRHGVGIFVACHTATCAMSACLALWLQRTTEKGEGTKTLIASEYPEIAAHLFNQTIVGFHRARDSTVFASFIFFWFLLAAVAWLYMLLSTLFMIFLNKTARHKQRGSQMHMAVIFMVRASAPLICLVLPAIACVSIMFLHVRNAQKVIVALSFLSECTGLLILGSIKFVVTPYRRALFRLLCITRLRNVLKTRKVGTTPGSKAPSSAEIFAIRTAQINLDGAL